MSIRDYLFGPSAATGSVEAPGASALNATRREAIPTAGGGFSTAVERLLGREGGYSNDAVDRGGATNFGISSRSYPDLDVSKLTRDQAAQIYKRDYWDAIEADKLPEATREIAFDSAVNHGVGRTRQLLAETGGDPERLIAARRKLYNDIVAKDPSQQKFHRGWMNRLDGLSGGKAISSVEEFGSGGGEFPMPSSEPRQRSAAWASIMGSEVQQAIPEGGVTGGDFGRAAAITAGDFVKAPLAALENLTGQLSGEGGTDAEKALAGNQRDLAGARRSIGEWQKGFFESMSPEAINMAQREFLTLDPAKTMWQGGVKDFMASTALKGVLSLGPTIGPMVTTALLSRLGVGASASTLFGAQEGLMSAGLTAAQIADDIEQTPMDELRKVERFRNLEAQYGEAEAKRRYTNDVQGVIPAVSGLLVGSIAKGVGKPLDKIFGIGEGLGLAGRIGTGAMVEGLQEGPQSFVEQVMQNYAEMAYNSDINLLDGAAEQVVQGMLLGGIMGGTFAGMFGNRPQTRALSSDPVPADIRAALGGEPKRGGGAPNLGSAIPTGGPDEGGGGGPTEPTAPDVGGLELAPDPTSTLVGDRLAPSEAQQQGGIPFEAPDTLPTDSVDFPQQEALTPGPRRKITAPKGAIPLELATRPSEQPIPEVPADVSPLDQAVAADVAAAAQGLPWDPNAQAPQPEQQLADVPQPAAGFEANQTRVPNPRQRTRSEQLGYRVRMRGPNGEILSSELVETGTRARLKAHQMERGLRGRNDGRYVEVLPARRTFRNDQTPTAEPVSDVMAQIQDMNKHDPLSRKTDPEARTGVYLTRETLDNLREAGLLDKALRGGVPIRNFDTYGGIMLAADEGVAQELMQLIEDPKSNIDEVIGLATGAGNGKPGGTNPVVQLLDQDGNVIRERQVTPEEAEPTKAAWGPMARVMPLEQALAIRQNRMQREKAERQVSREQQAFTETRPDQQVEDIFNENSMTSDLAEEAGARARQGGFEEDIGARLDDLAIETRADEKKRRKVDKRIPAPEDVQFQGRELVASKQKETASRRRANTLRGEVESLTKQVAALKAQIKERDKDAAENKVRVKDETYSDWLKKRAATLPANEQLAKLQQRVKDLTAEITELEESAKADKKSVEGSMGHRGYLSKEYAALYDQLRDGAIRVEMARKTGSVQAVTDAEADYDELIKKLQAFYGIEGGFTKAEALAKAVNRYSPKARKETLRAAAAAREEAQAAKDKAEEDALEVVRQSREERSRRMDAGTKTRDERIIARGDEAREEKKQRNIAEAKKVSIPEVAAKLSRMRKRISTPEGQRLVEHLFMVLSPSSVRNIDQFIESGSADEAIRRLEALKAAGKLSEKRFEWRKKLAMRRIEQADVKARTAVAQALIETNQLLQQWLSDYRLAIRLATSADVEEGVKRRNYTIFARAAELSEILGGLRAYQQGDISIADDAARVLAHRISGLVVHGKRNGVATEMDIDGFWDAIAKGPMAFRDYLADTVQSREDLPFPSYLTMADLEKASLGTLNALYVKAMEQLDGSRATDGQRREMVKAIKKAAYARGLKLSDKPKKVEIKVWNNSKHEYVTIPRTISPRKLFAETFRRSYGLKGADSRMSMEQLKHLYLNGAEIHVWDNGYVTFPNGSEKPNPAMQKGKMRVIKLPPLGTALPEAAPLNVRARRVPPEKKRRTIMRAVRAQGRENYGGKSVSTGLVRKATSDTDRARAGEKYNTDILLGSLPPRELGKRAAEYDEKRSTAVELLSTATTDGEVLLANMATAKWTKAAGGGQEVLHAKAYVRWLYEYGVSLQKADPKSWKGIYEMRRVGQDLMELASLSPEEFVSKVNSKFRAEMNEQVFRAVALDPVNLKGLRDPKTRAKLLAESHDRLRKIIMFHKRLTEAWQQHPIFLQDIQPVLNKISDSIQRDGWPSAKFTAEEREAVKRVLEEWKTARDLPLMERGKLYQAWGVPAKAGESLTPTGKKSLEGIATWAENLYDDFYMPLSAMLRDSGFFNPDEALMKQYSRRFSKYDDQSTGPVEVLIEGENWKGQAETARRFASVATPDPVALAAAELDQRKAEIRDRELAAMDDDEAEELNAGEAKRRKQLISSPLGRTATSARKLLAANDTIVQFHKVLYNPAASVRQVALAEARMLTNLREAGLLTEAGGKVTIGIPSAAPVIDQLTKELADLREAESDLEAVREPETADEFSTVPLMDIRAAKEKARIAGEIRDVLDALDTVRELALGNKRARTIDYTPIGERLSDGELTKEAARLEAGSVLTGFQVKAPKAERLGEERAKTRGDKLKERAKAAAEEKKRREGMTYEQRKAAESYDRRGYGKLKFDVSAMESDYGNASEPEYEAFFGLRDRLRSNPSSLGELLSFIGDKLGPDHKYQPLIRLINKFAAHRELTVRFSQDMESDNPGSLLFRNGVPEIHLNEDLFTQIGYSPLRALHVVMHEAVHAATTRKMTDNQPMTDALNMLRKVAISRLGGKFEYATGDVFEFVAEAYTNSEFQRALKAIKVSDVKDATVWTQFVTWVRNLLGFDPQFDNLLDAVISLQTQTFGGDPYNRMSSRKVMQYKDEARLDFKDPHVQSLADSAFMQNEIVQDSIKKASSLGNRVKEGGQSFLLKALSMRQLDQFYSRYFSKDGKNPLSKYMEAFEGRNSYASELLEEADKLSRRWTEVESNKKDEGVELSRIMHDATVQGVHADEAGSALNGRFRALSPAAQQLYKDVREYYKTTQQREVKLMLANALRASKLWDGTPIEAEDIDLEGITKGDWLQKKLGFDVKAEKAKLLAAKKSLDNKAFKAREADFENTVEEMKLIARMANIPTLNDGPYFPLMRFGDYAVKAERVKAHETYATRKERSEAMDAWQEQDPTLQFSFPETEDGFGLTVSEVEFRLAETATEAKANREELLADYAGGTVTPVQLKHNLMNKETTISSNRALQTLLGKLDGNAAAQAAMREFYIKSLSDRSFRKREAKRKNMRGADPTKQHRTFGAYSKSASYYTSQLKYGHIMADAKAEMQQVIDAHADESEISALRMGQIREEIVIRDDQAATITDVPAFVRKAVETGQVWLLLSPSYWMINATQPWMVTVPWLAGRSDMVTATKALAHAQSLIIDPLVTQGIKSWGGVKAIRSRLAAEQAFGVLENVEATLKQKLGADAKPLLDMLTTLKRESIIDLSFIAELRNIAEGQDKTAWDRVMDASRVMAHLTEVNNRIMTAIAAYNVAVQQHRATVAAGKVRMTEQQIHNEATDFAKRAVAETQFDYSAANKPRLFSSSDAWWKPLVFQFMQYIQHMYVLFVRHAAMWWNAPRESNEAKVGRRVVLGLLGTHLAAGGMLGVTPQLAKWGIGLALMAFGAGDDADKNFKHWASGDYYDNVMSDAIAWLVGNGKAGEALRAGLPRLAGFDLSNRLAFLQTYMVDLDTKNADTLYGSLVTSFGGPMFGIAGNAFMAAQLALEGDADKAIEKLAPKMGRDAVRAVRYWREGLVDNSGKTIVGADKMSPWEIFLTSMGFQPSQISETYARNTRARESEGYVAQRKAEISKAYRKARSTGEMSSVMADLREHNRQHPNPKDRISMSQLIRSARQMQKAERNVQRYGVDAGRRSREYDDDTYNVE